MQKDKRKIWAMDCETDPFKRGRVPKPFLWACTNGEEDFVFYDTKKFVEFLKKQDGIFYAHNGGKFDFYFLKDFFDYKEYPQKESDTLFINGRLVKTKIGEAEIRDSWVLFPFPQAAFVKKHEIEDWSIFEKEKRNLKKNKREILERCLQDIRGLHKVITEFEKEYGRHLTAPSAAFKQLHKIEKLKKVKTGALYYSDFENFYYGGRCEVFKTGHFKNIYYYDINSAYPWAMAYCYHPIGDLFFEEKNVSIKKPIKEWAFYHVKGFSDGVFPERAENGGISFPIKSGEFHVTGHELKQALELKAFNGKILRVICHAEKIKFPNFINHFWAIRQSTFKIDLNNFFAKLMMNSAYGKFGMNGNKHKNYFFVRADKIPKFLEKGYDVETNFEDKFIVSKKVDEPSFNNLATAASITGAVRAKMMKEIYNNRKRVIYCDTDSIFVSKPIKGFSNSKTLGDFKIEGIYDEGYFCGKKIYGVKNKKETKISCKGAKATWAQIKKINDGKIHVFKSEAPTFSWKKEKVEFIERKIVNQNLMKKRK